MCKSKNRNRASTSNLNWIGLPLLWRLAARRYCYRSRFARVVALRNGCCSFLLLLLLFLCLFFGCQLAVKCCKCNLLHSFQLRRPTADRKQTCHTCTACRNICMYAYMPSYICIRYWVYTQPLALLLNYWINQLPIALSLPPHIHAANYRMHDLTLIHTSI